MGNGLMVLWTTTLREKKLALISKRWKPHVVASAPRLLRILKRYVLMLDSQPLSHIPDDMRNVTVAHGTRETLPLHLFAGAEIPTNDAIADFARAVRMDTPPPLLVASPPTCCAYGHAPISTGCFSAASEISPAAEGVHY